MEIGHAMAYILVVARGHRVACVHRAWCSSTVLRILFGYRPEVVTLPSGLLIDLSVVLGVIGTLLAFALFVCTGMIYACLRFLREWNSPLTVIKTTS